jgi:hypothetical protein
VSERRDRQLAEQLLRMGKRVLFAPVCAVGLNRWVVGLPQQYPAGVPRESQTSRQTRTLPLAGMARDRDWHSRQENSAHIGWSRSFDVWPKAPLSG